MKSRSRLLMTIGIPVIIIIVVVGAYLWQQRPTGQTNTTVGNKPLTTVKLALDWTPNTNHTGIFVAMAQKWYQQEGINLEIEPYSSNVSPDVLVSSGKADVGISSTEGVVADAASGQPVVSIAAIVQHNTSELAALASSGITSPKDLDGKMYGAFGAPYENAVISQVIKHAGGTGNFKSTVIDIDPLQALQTHRVDFVWIFQGAEGIQAADEGMKLVTFPIVDNGIADYYTPTFISSPKEIQQQPDLLKRFMTATARGYEYAQAHPQQAAQMLIQENPKGTFPSASYVLQSQEYLSPRYVDPGRQWGLQDASAWHNYPEFMLSHGGVTDASGKVITSMNLNALYTNQFLP
jgi:ABC-type nitrate/sulfonate/bicarbonate transport system substrate-binding protein